MNVFNHQQINVNGASTHLIEAGEKEKQTILFLHGYPEDWMAFSDVMLLLKDNYHLLAVDMPGIGKSNLISSGDKLSIAYFINDLIQQLDLKDLIVVGQDLGGMVAYSLIRNFPERIAKAVIMNTAVPGVPPWEEVKRNPYIWHFAFFAIPELPEKVFEGKQDLLFNYFFNSITTNKEAFTEEKKRLYVAAYDSAVSMKTGFDWYRAFIQDEKENSKFVSVNIPVLYLRGEKEYGDISQYIEGFKSTGIKNIRGRFVQNSGHYAADESPEYVAKAIDDFIDEKSS